MGITTAEEFNRVFANSNELWGTDFFQKHGLAAIEEWANQQRDEFATVLHRMMREMGSPLEAAFYSWWMVCSRLNYSFGLSTQREVVAAGSTYRLDFVVEPMEYGILAELHNHRQRPKIAIELDGHDFHEKTKEQVTYRNRRDRDLQADGWIVLHVSGSEFNADPYSVTKEIYDRATTFMFAAFHRLKGQGAI